jgi:hypothetical protein
MRGGAVAARWAHNPKVAGSNPAPATYHTWPTVDSVGHAFFPIRYSSVGGFHMATSAEERSAPPSLGASLREWVSHSRWLTLLVLFAPILVAFRNLLRADSLLFGGDLAFDYYPMTITGMTQWRAGMVPLWTSKIQTGFPLLAHGQGALLYPPTVLSFLLFPGPLAWNLVNLAEVLLAALFMYAFVRRLGLGRLPALLAAWVYVFAGPIAGSLGLLHGFVWWPLLFWLAEALSDGSRQQGRLIGAAAVAMGVGWLGGFPQTMLPGVLAASAYLVVRAWMQRSGAWRTFAVALGSWAAAGILGLGIGAAQLLPTLEMSGFSVRAGGVDTALATQGSMFPTGWAGFLLPTWTRLSGFWLAGPNLYIGLAALATVLLAWGRGADRRGWFFWGLAAVACVLSLGRFSPLYGLVRHLPGLNLLRIPARFLWWAEFSLAVLLAMGLQRLMSAPGTALLRRLRGTLLVLLGLAFGGAVLGTLVAQVFRARLLSIATAYTQRSMVGQAYRVQGADYYQARVRLLYDAIRGALNPATLQFAVLVAVAAAALVILSLWIRRPGRAGWPRLVFAGLLALELCWSLVLRSTSTTPATVLNPPPLAQALPQQVGSDRLFELITQSDLIESPTALRYATLSPNYNLLAGVSHVGVYSPLGERRYYDLLGALGDVDLSFGKQPSSAQILATQKPLLDLLGAGFVVSQQPLDVPGLTLLQAGPPWLYRNAGRLPRAFVTPAAVVAPSADAVLKALHSPTFEPTAAVWLEAPPDAPTQGGVGSTARVVSYADERVVLDAAGPGWLLLTDLDYPGWGATVDGAPVTIYRGDYVFRAVYLGPGQHTVVFTLGAGAFGRGALLAAGSLLVVVLLMLGPLLAYVARSSRRR